MGKNFAKRKNMREEKKDYGNSTWFEKRGVSFWKMISSILLIGIN